ncbi:MAG TPA: ArsR family transcriptional regulator [Longimicrobiales bacterium]
MHDKRWRQRMLATTRGRVLSLLRWGPRTVSELAAAIGFTDNAVRIHLSSLERDGLVEQEGVRRSGGKPAYVYRLSSEAESLFPKAYATVLSEVLAVVREQQGPKGLEAFLRQVGRRAGDRAKAGAPSLRDRVDAAVAVLGEIGGLADVQESDEAYTIRGFSCPLSAIIGSNPEACALAEELVRGVVGAPVMECCDRGNPPRCSFRISREPDGPSSTAA